MLQDSGIARSLAKSCQRCSSECVFRFASAINGTALFDGSIATIPHPQPVSHIVIDARWKCDLHDDERGFHTHKEFSMRLSVATVLSVSTVVVVAA